MNIWIIQIGEPTPEENNTEIRYLRSGIVANILASKGHAVTWFSSDFDHSNKRYRKLNHDKIKCINNLKIVYLHGCSYKYNVCFKRVLNHVQVALHFLKVITKCKKPDVILTSYPTIELSLVSVLYGRLKKIPTFVDIRDLWPADFVNLFPRYTRNLAKVLFTPYYFCAYYIFNFCSARTAVTEGYLKFGQKFCFTNNFSYDRSFLLSLKSKVLTLSEIKRKKERLKAKKIELVFSGMLGASVDLKPIFLLGQLLSKEGVNVKIHICGAGDKLLYYKNMYKQSDYIIFHGFLKYVELNEVIQRSMIGIIPYFGENSLVKNIPNKVGEYLNHGLTILNSLKGTTEKFVENHDVGINFISRTDKDILKAKKEIIDFIGFPDEYEQKVYASKKCFSKYFNSYNNYNNYCNWLTNYKNES